MESGYKRKISSIVDKIVDGKIKSNKNSTLGLEDESIKDDMASSIGKTIAILNNDGQKQVLEELEVLANESSMEFLSNDGTVNIKGLIETTQKVVDKKNKRSNGCRSRYNSR